ncbi:hypothetical protein CMI40_00170 [Candidatus Pacearchaeota archaeon]|mgnify:CR=1 FL=1|nr:hypothetical protein [Candidatus Pacearchaeota archaeon]|tara:strand:+ start:7040 stop:7321 length:282 start_codon:yes stop_codon:yes gene_type:complete
MAGKNSRLELRVFTEDKIRIQEFAKTIGEDVTTFCLKAINQKIKLIQLKENDETFRKKVLDNFKKLDTKLIEIKKIVKLSARKKIKAILSKRS